MNNKGFVFKVDDIDKNQEGAIEKVAKDIAKELDINALEKTLEYITGEEVNKSCEDFNNGYRTALYRVMSLVTNQQQELDKYKNIIDKFDKWLLGEEMMFYKSSDGGRLIRYGETKKIWLELKGSDE